VTLDDLFTQAAAITVQQRQAFAGWAASALTSERQTALHTVKDEAERTGRARQQAEAMDRAFKAVAASAGVSDTVSYWDDDRGRGDRNEWVFAADIAAEVAAVLVVEDHIAPEMRDFLLEPWDRFMS
jgi:uncharacterized protein with GYD domain